MRSDRMKLIGGWQACDALAQISEVLRIDRKTRDFINHGQEVSQRANDSERWSIGGTRQTARGGQRQIGKGLDRYDESAALRELRS